MGFKPWCKLGVLVLAGATLVGCNNGAQKDKQVIGQTSVKPPANGALSDPNRSPFPIKDNQFTPIGGVSQTNKASDPTFGMPPNPKSNSLVPPIFPPMDRSPAFSPESNSGLPANNGLNGLPPLGPSGSGNVPSIQLPTKDGFATGRETNPPIPVPGSGQITPIPVPNNFLQR